jgi:hypothetical protein
MLLGSCASAMIFIFPVVSGKSSSRFSHEIATIGSLESLA